MCCTCGYGHLCKVLRTSWVMDNDGSWSIFLKHKDISLPWFWSHFIAKICVFLFVFLPVFKCLARKIRYSYYIMILNYINQIEIRMEHIVVFYILWSFRIIKLLIYILIFVIVEISYRNISSPPFCPFDCCCTFFLNPIWNDGKLFPGERTKGWQTALRIIFSIGHFDEDNEEGNLQWPPQRNTQISPKIKRQFIETSLFTLHVHSITKAWLDFDNTS